MILGIIPARGGSKRLPRKNIRELCGKSMLAWTIEAARQSRTLDRFVVSTEDAEIAGLAETLGAEVIDRPVDYAQDASSVYDAIFDVLDDIPATWVVLLQPTSPLRTSVDIDAAVNLCLTTSSPACVSCTAMEPVPNGAVYVAYTSWLREHKNFDGPRTIVYQMPPHRSVDINTLQDFERAERLLRANVAH